MKLSFLKPNKEKINNFLISGSFLIVLSLADVIINNIFDINLFRKYYC